MAIKKCEEIIEGVLVETGETTPESAGFTPASGGGYTTESRPTSLGKTLDAVEDALFFNPLEESPWVPAPQFGNGRIAATRPSGIEDPLRAEARKFFVLDNNGTMVYLNDSFGENLYGVWQSDNITTVATSSPLSLIALADPLEVQASDSLFKKYAQSWKVSSTHFVNNPGGASAGSGQEGRLYSDAELDVMWTLFVDGMAPLRHSPLIDTTKVFTDHYTDFTIPFSQKELERYINIVHNPAYANVEPNYNFFEKGYENAIEGSIWATMTQGWPEAALPNLYSIMTKDGNQMQTSLADLGIGSQYVRNVQSLLEQSVLGVVAWSANINHFNNIAFPSSQIPSLQQGYEFDDVHPMNNTLELQTEKTGEFFNAVELSGMTDSLLKTVMNEAYYTARATNGTPSAGGAMLTTQKPFALSTEKIIINIADGTSTFKTQVDIRDISLMDLKLWVEDFLTTTPSYQITSTFYDSMIFLGIPENQSTAPDECNAFRDALQAIILSGKIQQLINDHSRTFEQVLMGKEAYNETIIYEIVKSSPTTGAEPLQRIFIPNTDKLNVLNYIDTQVKYDKEYTYEIFAHNLIVGTQYEYREGVLGQTYIPTMGYAPALAVHEKEFTVFYEPSLKIARLPIYKQAARILDAAPVWPHVDLIPYKGVSDQFLINLNSNTGDYDLQPIIINERDAIFVRNFRNSRQLLPGEPINFKSDDPVQHFEIYRMDTPPSSYEDFAGHLLTVEVSQNATAISYVDNISPNQKYYYTFRAVDVHQNRSNPTEIYQVEIVEFDGMMFFYTSIYNLNDPLNNNNNVSSTRSLKRYLKINPNFIQSLINYEDTFANTSTPDATAYDAGTMVLGQQAEGSVWSSATNQRKFKIRVTSKNSGRKFDLNLTCKVQFNRGTQPT
jgi:hypothetical protein